MIYPKEVMIADININSTRASYDLFNHYFLIRSNKKMSHGTKLLLVATSGISLSSAERDLMYALRNELDATSILVGLMEGSVTYSKFSEEISLETPHNGYIIMPIVGHPAEFKCPIMKRLPATMRKTIILDMISEIKDGNSSSVTLLVWKLMLGNVNEELSNSK